MKSHHTRLLTTIVSAAAALMLLTAPAPAATLVFGDSAYNLDTVEGNNSAPGFTSAGGATTVQIQIVASDLAAQGLLVGSTITGVSMRINGGVTMTGDRSVSDLEITLAQAAFAIGSMSTTFVSNMVSPLLVKDGAITFFDAQMPDGSTPNAFGQLVSFDTPYTYQGGDLVYMFTRTAGTGGTGANGDLHNGGGTIVRQLSIKNSFSATTGTLSNLFEVPQFTFTSSVPEPSRALLLLMSGLLSMALRRRRSV